MNVTKGIKGITVFSASAVATLLGFTLGTVGMKGACAQAAQTQIAQNKTGTPTMSDKRDKINAKMGKAKGQEKGVYVDPDGKEFYTPAQAIMCGYMNENGKNLVRKMSTPAGYKATDDIGKMYIDPDEKEYYTPTQAKMCKYVNESGKKLVKMEKMPVGYKPTDDMGKLNKMKKAGSTGSTGSTGKK